MKYMTFEKTDVPICIIKDNKQYKKSKIIYLDSDNETNYKFNQLQISEGYLQLIPNEKVERQILYICGATGSGKTYFTGQYLREYKKLFSDNAIYMFSTIPKGDPSLKDIDINYINLETLLEEELTAKDFENSMVIFDDTECLTNRKIKEAVIKIQSSVLETGRHYRVSCILTNHEAYNGIQTKNIK
jgi:chromosomal replication initiation ATPase DnaA